MKNEAEIKEKLRFYETALKAFKTAEAIKNPEFFLTLSQQFPEVAMRLLLSTVKIDELVRKLPPEDQEWCRRSFEVPWLFCQQAIEERVSILKWLLEDE